MSGSIQPGAGLAALHIQPDRLSHAYILAGPSVSGRRAAAALLAAAMVCASPVSRPCGACAHCRKAAAGIHPDILFLRREPDRQEIQVRQIRALQAEASVLPNEAERKVYIVEEAEAMNAAAQNAMLKLLEEPPAHAAFLLETDNAGALLETVRSRCVELNITESASDADTADSRAEEDAAELVRLVQAGDRLGVTALLFSLEQADRQQFSAFLTAAFAQAVTALGRAEPHTDGSRRLSVLVRALRRTDDFQIYNVSVGHIVGLLLAELV